MVDVSKLEKLCKCDSCFLSGTKKVFGRGKLGTIMLIGQAPGQREEATGLVFWGKSSAVLRMTLEEMGQDINNLYLTNTILCRPPKAANEISQHIIDACHNRLLAEIEMVSPKRIVCLGDVAAKAVLRTKKGLGVLRETIHTGPLSIPTHVTFHPAYIMRDFDMVDLWFDDLLNVFNPPEPVPRAKYKVVATLPEAIEPVAFDIETSSLIYALGNIGCAGFYYPRFDTTFILEDEFALWKNLQVLTKNSAFKCDVHNLIFEYSWMYGKYGINLQPHIRYDTMLEFFSRGHRRVGLKELGAKYLHLHNWEREFKKTLPPKSKSYLDAPKGALYQYLAYDCYATSKLTEML